MPSKNQTGCQSCPVEGLKLVPDTVCFLLDHGVRRHRCETLGTDAQCGALNLSLLYDIDANQFHSSRAFWKSANRFARSPIDALIHPDVIKDLAGLRALGNECDQGHLPNAQRAQQREHFVNTGDQHRPQAVRR